MSLFKTNSTNDYRKIKNDKNMSGRWNKPSKLKIQKQSEDNIIENIRNLSRLKTKCSNQKQNN